ncbi:protein-PII uridylyltransferase [[Actinobacillus] muris]|uniref:Bifunctional uridylyltransferase/uridylyl-removing enzyme n=1 Tax=Muribacter muris TaxID=67855 RepID=A0A0J5P816_9PAST|nr:bifunctional uridylyltransferase/uridylyl-removing protein GlnD [Muribacter muris]KMK52366.1 protein-PII uridylyltransferase [[Actinobacillus] muris] [Muribacter muris]
MLSREILKYSLTEFTQQQATAFQNSPILSLLQQRSDFYDQLLLQLWQQFGFADRQDLALIAVGGYGRREMFPLSDLDILLLTDTPLAEPDQMQFNQLLNLLWDSKFQVGSSVRTLTECLDIGRNEISVATNMFESRFLCGKKALWQALMSSLYQPDFWSMHDFFHAKIAEKTERYARYHNTSYNLEPDLKHSPGGLRDLHLIAWIMLRQYGIHSLEAMSQKGILFPEEYQELSHAQTVLFRMRFALHLQLKRYDNRLRFDRQLQLSEQLGYTGEGNQPVEAMMKAFFRATQSISQLSRLVLAHFEQTILSPLQKKGDKLPLDECYFLRDNLIFCHNQRDFSLQPQRILDLFYHLTQQPNAKVSATTLRQLRLALKKLNQPLSDLPEARQCFLRLFKQPRFVQRAIVPMHQLGVLSSYLPQWRDIEGLMQFDMFHLYTVDEHTVRVMLKLESFLDPQNAEKHPLCCELMPRLAEPSRLYLAALFHDIGKGREGDHATVGAADMRQFALQHQFSPAEADEMAWLVAEHLTMSVTAQRRDIHDAEVIRQFAKKVKNLTALSALTCLTVADICATNKTLWNDWKRSLFLKLFQLTRQQLALGDQSLDTQTLARQHQQTALNQLTAELGDTENTILLGFWQHCPLHYFTRHTPTQLVWHAIKYVKNPQLPMVLVSNQYARGATEIFIYAADQPQLFARLAQTLSQKKITIHDAQIITSENGLVLDSFIVSEINGQPLNDDRSRQIHRALHNTLSQTANQTFKLIKKPIKHQSFRRKTKLRFLADSHPNQTAFELFTLDREGLLAHIGDIFNRLSLNLLNAKITTIGERAEDFFVVSNNRQQALSEAEKQALTDVILAELTR